MDSFNGKSLQEYLQNLANSKPLDWVENYDKKEKTTTDKVPLDIFTDIAKKSDKIITENSLETFNFLIDTAIFVDFLKELKADPTTSYIGKALQAIYNARLEWTTSREPVYIQVCDNEKVCGQIKIDFFASSKTFKKNKQSIEVAKFANFNLKLEENGIEYAEIQKSMEQVKEKYFWLNTLYNDYLRSDRTNFQGLSQLLLEDNDSHNVDLQRTRKYIQKMLQQYPESQHVDIQKQIYTTMFELYIQEHLPNKTTLIVGNIDIYSSKKIYVSLYSGTNEYDDKYPSNFTFNLSTLVQFVDLLQKFEKVRSTELFIKISGTPPKKSTIKKDA